MNRALVLGRFRWPMLAVGVALCLGGAYVAREEVVRRAQEDFRGEAIDKVREIDLRLRSYSDILYAMRGLMDSSPAVTRGDFHRFAEALSLAERYPSLTNISFSIRVAHADRAAFESAVRAETGPLLAGLPPFAIKPPGVRDEYFVLHFVEPMGENATDWGLDLMADDTRRAMVERARDSGAISAASMVMLQDSQASAASTLLRLGVYRGGGAPVKLANRQRQLYGVVGTSVRIGTLVEAALAKGSSERLRVRVLAREEPGSALEDSAPATLLYDSNSSLGGELAFANYAVETRVAVGDREWAVVVTPLVDPAGSFGTLLVVGGLLVSLALWAGLFWLASALVIGHRRGLQLWLRNREALQLTTLGAELHSCVTLGEAYIVIARRMPDLLPGTAGALHLPGGAGQLPKACWGDYAHLTGPPPPGDTCIPLTSHGETSGMLHVQRPGPAGSPAALIAERNLMTGAAQHVALAVANLQLREKLVERATRDNLTGLYNRHYMREWFEQELARAERHGRSIGVIAIDADHFKRFNDSFSHAAGDAVLRELAGAIRRLARRSDVVCRLGGEEFLLLMPEATLAGTVAKAEQLRRQVAALVLQWEGRKIGSVTISAGVAMFPQHAATVDGLLRLADQALYVSKQQGRDRVTLANVAAHSPDSPVAA